MQWEITRRKFLRSSAGLFGATFIDPVTLLGKAMSRVRFGLITDSHYADRDSAGTRYYREALAKMRECVQVLNSEAVDFAIHLGDLKDEDKNKRESGTLKYLQAIEAEYANFRGPRYHCIGNHDLDSISKAQFLQNIENTGISQDQGYYSFDQKGFHFIVLDPNYHPDGRHHHKGDFKWYDARLPEHEWEWFENDLLKTQLPTIVFCHFTLYNFTRDGHPYYITDYPRAQKLLEASGKVMAVFQGHVHQEDFVELNGIHYCTQLGMVDYSGLENNSFAIVEITSKEIKIDGYKRAATKKLGKK